MVGALFLGAVAASAGVGVGFGATTLLLNHIGGAGASSTASLVSSTGTGSALRGARSDDHYDYDYDMATPSPAIFVDGAATGGTGDARGAAVEDGIDSSGWVLQNGATGGLTGLPHAASTADDGAADDGGASSGDAASVDCIALFWACAGVLAPLASLAMAYFAATMLLLEVRPLALRMISPSDSSSAHSSYRLVGLIHHRAPSHENRTAPRFSLARRRSHGHSQRARSTRTSRRRGASPRPTSAR